MNRLAKIPLCLILGLGMVLAGCQSRDSDATVSSKDTEQLAQDTVTSPESEPTQAPKVAVNPCPECGQKREFRGEFVYFADAAVLTPCDSTTSLVVAVNPKMQLAYELHRKAPEAPLYFVAKGQVELMPSMEEGQVQKQLVVDGDNWYFDAYASCQ